MRNDLPSLPSSFLQCALFLAAIGLLALTVLVQTNPATRLPSRDYGFYLYIGDRIVNGDLPYRDAWESKPPAIFYLNAVALCIGRGSRWGVWIVEYVFLIGAIGLSFHLQKKLWGVWPAAFGVLVWLIGLDATLQGGNFTEEYPLLFHFISLVLFVRLIENPKNRLDNLILGLMFSLAFLFRPNNAVIEALVILALALVQGARRKVRPLLTQILWISLGVLPPILMTIAYFWSQGLLRDLLEASILYNLTYSGTQLTGSSPLTKGFQHLGMSAWVALIGYVAALYQLRKSFSSPSFYLLALLLVGWPITIYLSDPARRSYGHYFMNCLPFVGLLSGFALHTLQTASPGIERMLRRSSSLASAILLVLTAGYFVGSGRVHEFRTAVERVFAGPGIELRSLYADYVETHTRPGEYVLFWHAFPGENFMSNRRTPSSTLFYPTLVRSEISDKLNDRFLRDLIENTPVLIVDMGYPYPLSLDPQKRREQRAAGVGWPFPPDNLEEVFAFIEENYYLEAEVGKRSVYRLRGTQGP